MMDPYGEMGDSSKNCRIHREHATTAPAHYSNLHPDVVEFTDEWASRITLEEKSFL